MPNPPRIDSWEPEDEKIKKLAGQVQELIEMKRSFKTAMSAVLNHRYGGRFRNLYKKVASHLGVCSGKKRKQMEFPLGA